MDRLQLTPKVLVVDDEDIVLASCHEVLQRRGCEVDTERDPFDGRDRALCGKYDVVLLDVRMPGLDGLEILSSIRERRSDVEVIIMTGYSTVDLAVQSVKLGAFDYLSKPFTPEELTQRVGAAFAHLEESRRAAVPPPLPGEWTLIGDSEAMARVRALIARVAPSDATVLILGESGTGKEIVANAIHASGQRRDRPFVSMDCSALAPGLLESELFGHVTGSFTGAVATKPGLFEIADRGTLFLDEVSNLSMETQGKLLRVLETGEMRAVGGVDTRKVDIRLIAASSRELSGMVEKGVFREDLFYRLNVVPIRLPPLRERPSDVALLFHHFLESHRRPNAVVPRRISPEALERLGSYAWPGNVRELRNLVERLVVTTEGDTIRLENLPEYIEPGLASQEPRVPMTNAELKAMKRGARQRADGQLERAFVLSALRRNDWNVSRAALETGLLRPNFHALMRKYRIRVQDLKD
jgi:DNA-binding NtrC family response regulator